MGFFKKRAEEDGIKLSSELLTAILSDEYITVKKAMNVPTFAGCVNKICETVSMIPIYLYKTSGDSVERQTDIRVDMLNRDTRDTLTGSDFKKAIIYDYLTNKGGYAYINRIGKEVRSIHYVSADDISFLKGIDPIFKDYEILCAGNIYQPYQFIKILRRTKNGYSSPSMIDENREILMTAYKSLMFEKYLVSKGGNKRGFLESEHGLSDEAIRKLKESFNLLYQDRNENVIVLNNGVKFKESSETSTEMQQNENKKSNAVEICKIFGMPPNILGGNATEQDKLQYIQYCIVPILEAFCEALNRDLLLEREKKDYFFAPDINEFTRGDIRTRFDAYAIAYKAGFMQADEIRKRENLPSLGIPYVKMGLQDALYNPDTGSVFTLNTGRGYNIKDAMDGKVMFDENGVPTGQLVDTNSDETEADTDTADGKEQGNEDRDKS